MKNSAALSIGVSCFALSLGALSACSGASTTGYGTPDAASPVVMFNTEGTGVGTAAGSGTGTAGPSPTSGTGTGGAVATSASSSNPAGESSGGSGSASSSMSAAPTNPGDPEPQDMIGMTAAHNAARAAVQPAATPALPTVSWSATIAASAQAFTTNCVFADTTDAYGSNAFAGTGKSTPEEVVASWVGEDAYYDYASNSCEAGQQCGHYTQVVWRDSVQIGCGMTNCTENSPFTSSGKGAWQLWVCNYNPAGNYVGQQPY
jgi:pathogenesis-related protein 1